MNEPRIRSLGVLTALALGLILLGGAAPAENLPDGGGATVIGTTVEVWELGSYDASPEAAEIRAAIAAAESGGAAPDLLAELIHRCNVQDVPPQELLQMIRHCGEIGARDLPVSPILSRYLQGMAKGVPFPRVQSAVEDLEARLAEAAVLVDAALPPPADAEAARARLTAIDHGAYALGVGVTGDDLDRSIALVSQEERPMEQVQAPILTMGVLVASGVEPDRSLEVVSSAWQHGYRGNELERLGKALGRLGGEGGTPPADVVDQVIALIDDEADQDRIFQGLDELTGPDKGANRPPGVGPGEDPAYRRGPPKQPKEPGTRNQGPQRQIQAVRN